MSDQKENLRRAINRLRNAFEELVYYARKADISFVASKDLPFGIKYDATYDTWSTTAQNNDSGWTESGCTIGVEDFDEGSWNSSSDYC
jgi:hypothetical protein